MPASFDLAMLLLLGTLAVAASPAPIVEDLKDDPRRYHDIDLRGRPWEERHTAGKWIVTVCGVLAGTGNERVVRFDQEVLRQGPDDKAAVCLFSQRTARGAIGIRLRDDGLLLIQPVGKHGRLYFPGSAEPVELVLPTPQKLDSEYHYLNAGQTWFLDDVLLYDRKPTSDCRQIGFVRIDLKKKSVAEGRVCLELGGRSAAIEAAALRPMVFRAGDHVFGVNAGWPHMIDEDQVKAEWKTSQVRVLDLKAGALITPDRVPEEALRRHKDRILDFLEKEAHIRCPELETWALTVLARVGAAQDADRLRVLLRTVPEGPMRQQYATALQALEKK